MTTAAERLARIKADRKFYAARKAARRAARLGVPVNEVNRRAAQQAHEATRCLHTDDAGWRCTEDVQPGERFCTRRGHDRHQ